MKNKPVWNLKLLYKSENDPQIEKDLLAIEERHRAFAEKYDTAEKSYLKDENQLFDALTEFEEIVAEGFAKPLHYFMYLRDIDNKNSTATSQIPLITARLTNSENQLNFFKISIGKIDKETQNKFLSSDKLKPFRYLLNDIFESAKHDLSVVEERIMSLKSQPAYDMWVDQNQRILTSRTVKWKGKTLPMASALNMIQGLKSHQERGKLWQMARTVLGEVGEFSEGEINAVITNKKINDELRGYAKPYDATVRGYENDPKVVENLVKTVTDNFAISHKYFKLKAKLLKQKKLEFYDRGASIGQVKAKFTFEETLKKVSTAFETVDPKYAKILAEYISQGQIDAFPRLGKKDGAYCWGEYNRPTFVLLNHVDNIHSFTTLAHEMGHAFHTEASKKNRPLFWHYSTALAETASTLFEAIAIESIFDSLSDKEKIILLHDRINDDIATVFRQIACFNFELDLHNQIRSKGFLTKNEIAAVHNRNMQAYFGPAMKLEPEDGYFFVTWSHIRRFFYVYSYAYGQLVSKAMLRRYRADHSFWQNIEKFLASGSIDTPENILKSCGIDVTKPEFWLDGLREIENDIAKLEKLTSSAKI